MLKILFAICFFITACSAITSPDDFTYEEIQTTTFKIAAWHKITNPQAPIKVYIEGDGAAFRTNGKISANPTPHGTLVRKLAFGDNHANVVYLARPCQFVQDTMCTQKYWSTARFAPEIIASEYEALQKIGGNNPLTLVGFSGGAQIAGLLAVKYPHLNVKKLVTIAGNLDHTAWTTYHHLLPLTLSADLKNYRQQYLTFEQVHYIGKKDDNILPFITENFVGDKNRLVYIEDASHNTGWQSAYGQIQAQ